MIELKQTHHNHPTPYFINQEGTIPISDTPVTDLAFTSIMHREITFNNIGEETPDLPTILDLRQGTTTIRHTDRIMETEQTATIDKLIQTSRRKTREHNFKERPALL